MHKERELYYLTKAQAVYSDLPSSSPVVSESPDFLFTTEAGMLGVEVTDYIRGLLSTSVTLRTLDSLHRMVAQNANTKFETRHRVSLWVGLHWNNQFKLTKKDIDRIGSQLALLIESDIPSKPYAGTIFDLGELPIFEAIHRVSVRRLKVGVKGGWAAIEAGFIESTVADIQAIIDRKEPKINSYRSRCDEVWLLIVADGTHISSSLDLKFEPGSILQTQFTRVLLYDGFSNVVTLLK